MGVFERVERGSGILTKVRSKGQVSILVDCELENVAVAVGVIYAIVDSAHDLNGMARKLAKLQCESSASCITTIHVAGGVYWCGEFGGDVGDERAGVFEGVMGMVGKMPIVGDLVVWDCVALAELRGRRLIAFCLSVDRRMGSTSPHRTEATVVVVQRFCSLESIGSTRKESKGEGFHF